MLQKFLFVATGGAVGALLRYGVTGLANRIFPETFPMGTLIINVAGSFIIGFLWRFFEAVSVTQNVKLLIFIGILGSFTTFSTFSLESFALMKNGHYHFLFLNIFLSIGLGLAFVFAGYFSARYAVALIK